MKIGFRLIAMAMVTLALTLPLRAAEVTVFAAASLTDSLKAVAAAYEKQSADTIRFNFGASSTLARQLAAGAPADLFFSADEAKMDALQKQGLIDPASRQSRLGNSLVIVVPADSSLQINSAVDLTNSTVKQIALADPKAVPAGIYAQQWLEKVHLWSVLKPKVVATENVRAALAAVASGNVDAGVVYKTDAGISQKVKIAWAVPPGDAPAISYPMALVKAAPQPAAAVAFLHYLASADAARIFAQFGFTVRP